MALPKANRLRHRQDFQAVYQSGIRRTGNNLILRALRQRSGTRGLNRGNCPPATPLLKGEKSGASSPAKGEENQKPTQIGISISQKVSKRAVIRNRIKRWIRAALRQLWPRLESGWQLVIVVKSGMATECDYAEILQELEQLLAEAEVINGN